MARPQQKGLLYFPFDVDFFSDKKIKILKARHGIKGMMLYIYLLCEVYKNGYYLKLDNDYEYLISAELHMSAGEIKQVMKFLLERSLFDYKLFQSDNVITSPGIQRRFQEAVKEKARKNPRIIDKFWLLSKEETQSFIKVTHFENYSVNNADNSRNNLDNSVNYDTKEKKEKENNNYCQADKKSAGPHMSKTNNQNSELIKQIIGYLNEKTGKSFKAEAAEARRHINARLNDGFTLEDFKTVIDNKTCQWLNNAEMNKYLRPMTLFSTKFESYLNENVSLVKANPERVIDDNSSDYKNWSEEKLKDMYDSLR